MENRLKIAVVALLPALALLAGCEKPPLPKVPAAPAPAAAQGSIPASLDRLGMAVRPGPQGPVIAAMDLDGPAAEAGAQVGDLVVAVNGAGVRDAAQLDQLVAAGQARGALQLDLMRRGEAKQLSVSLVQAAQVDASWNPLGLQVKELPEAARKALGIAFGVMVTKVRAPADRTRILPGDVIVGVGQARIHSMEEFNRLLGERGREAVGLLVRRADSDLYIPFEPHAVERPRLLRPPTDTPLRT